MKGQNLIEYLQGLQNTVTSIVAEINEINRRSIKLNNALLLHQHPEFLGIGGTPGAGLTFQIFTQYAGQFKTLVGTAVQNINLVIEELNYLTDDLPVLGVKNILSDSVYIT